MLTRIGSPLVVADGRGAVGPFALGPYAGSSYNADMAPSPLQLGFGMLDEHLGFLPQDFLGMNQQGPTCAYMFVSGGSYMLVDQAPSAVATANIAALANVTSGTPMTLVSSSGAGITVSATANTVWSTGNVIPAGTLIIDATTFGTISGTTTGLLSANGTTATAAVAGTAGPWWQKFGQNGAIAVMDPRSSIARAVSITGSTGATGGAFLVRSYDIYGFAQSETITAGAGAVTTNGKKGCKYLVSVTPQFTDAHNYSVGTADIYEFPLRVDEFAFADIAWNNGIITANTGFTAADTTSPATSATGSVRGTYATQSASDGTKKLQLFVSVAPWNMASVGPGNIVGLFGVTPA